MATSLEDVLKKAKKKLAENSNRKERPVKPAPGKSVWRILPGWRAADPNVFFHPYGQHWIKDLEGNLKHVIGCPSKTYDADCEICEMISEAAKNAPDDATRNAILESRATQTYLFNAYQPDGEQKVVILQFGSQLFEQLVDAMSEYPDLLDPAEGNDVVVSREGTGMNTKYALVVRPQTKSKPVPKSILMQLHNLDDYVQEDFEERKQKALDVISQNMGRLPSSAAPALTGPATTVVGADLDDEIPETPKAAAKPALDVEDAEISDSFGENVSDDELEDLLKDLS